MDLNSSEKLTVLLKAFDHSREHNQQLRARAMTIQTWIGSILLAVIGGIIALGPDKLPEFGAEIQLLLTIAVLSLFIFGWITEVLTFKARVIEANSAFEIVRLLHLFEENYFGKHSPIFNVDDWSDWKKNPLRKIGAIPSIAILFILTTVVTALIWIA
jgi:hypothetical protein